MQFAAERARHAREEKMKDNAYAHPVVRSPLNMHLVNVNLYRLIRHK